MPHTPKQATRCGAPATRPVAGLSARVAAIYLLAMAGCGAGNNTAPVKGTVLLDGKPLERGTVMFIPAGGRGAKGELGSGGRFELGTYGAADGALIGTHRVAVASFEAPVWPPNYDQDSNQGSKSALPPHYASADSSGLTYEVKPGVNEPLFELTSK